jgi:SLOG family YspA-like protein
VSSEPNGTGHTSSGGSWCGAATSTAHQPALGAQAALTKANCSPGPIFADRGGQRDHRRSAVPRLRPDRRQPLDPEHGHYRHVGLPMRTRVGNHRRATGRPGSAVTHRVLVTGSRTWVDVETIRAALHQVWGNGSAVLVSGACPRGANRIAEQLWQQWGRPVSSGIPRTGHLGYWVRATRVSPTRYRWHSAASPHGSRVSNRWSSRWVIHPRGARRSVDRPKVSRTRGGTRR